MTRDLDFFAWIAAWVERLQPGFRRLRRSRWCETFAAWTRLEMDLRLEAAAASELGRELRRGRGLPRAAGRLAAHRAAGADLRAGQRHRRRTSATP